MSRKSKKLPKGKPRSRTKLWILVIIFSILLGGALGVLTAYVGSAPSLDQVNLTQQYSTHIYDINGLLITDLYRENRVPIAIELLPEHLKNAVIAIEDDKFYQHHGIDFIAFGRAVLVNLREGRFAQGGGTITMQVARNLFLTQDKLISRKLQEFLWAVQIERKYSKQEILETYLNMVHLGHGANGVEAGAQLYFGKSAKDLTLPEAALLAGIIRWPARYSPHNNPDVALERRNFVLKRMFDLELITESEYMAARAEPVAVVERKARNVNAPYFVDYILDDLIERYGEERVFGGGLRIYTTLDLNMQMAAEKALTNGLPQGYVDSSGLTQPQGALIAIDPRNGHIRAMVGGRGEDKFNRSVQAYRSPGSAIKVFAYTAAIDKGVTAADIYVDEPVEYVLASGETWSPRNYHPVFDGEMTVREAIERSINTVAVAVVNQLGFNTVIEYGKKMGITSFVESGRVNDLGLSPLALGGLTKGVSPLEMASAYGVLANNGIRVEPIAILRVTDYHGNVLEENTPRKEVVLTEETSYIMTDLLRGVIERGTAKSARINRPAAGKTGTHQDNRDAWFVGYTPELGAAVWFGEDIPKAMVYNGVQYGSWNATPIWKEFMSEALRYTPISDFKRPNGIVEATIDIKTGLLVPENCSLPKDEIRTEIFVRGTEPTEYSPRCTSSMWQFLSFTR
ncbi:MAG: PBP1A family penicillin-binding protein [Firmicutes bacterium]|nr:PBP1A family penicillin-binding protein [Bacillota bacterium]NLL88533.1 PBP1A family penicillin-binding protein [Bacillota bacterium]HKM18394.1 PBP1A family penicillin-binding protein [Limnochordia bacterium]